MTATTLEPTSRPTDPIGRQAHKARQLLTASTKHSYDPELDIDWTAPLTPGKWFLPEHRCTLFGTDLWNRLTMEQKLAVSREEMASSMALGVWTEHMLLQLVARYVYDRDIATPAVQFALTEVADEVRHMIMFANVVESIGATTYAVPWKVRESGRLLKTAFPVQGLWALILLTEEIFDRIQREIAADESAQPVIRAMSRIHVVEEARHISFARAELDTFVPSLNKAELAGLRTVLALTMYTFGQELFNPEMYRRAGLDPRAARKAAMSNPANKATFAWAAKRVVTHYREIGLIGGSSEKIWRAGGFL
ncbi:MAG TPA: diiron oxygenase [Lapillicoccus sp.]|uniref:AurF N-oxygenase family protein n=1 Tax=Lapillicoccus sp. TaxID=1909287 RepID=UPI002F958BBD